MTRLPTDAARWQRVKHLLDRALQMPPGEQEEFLDDACGADPSLRREIDSLLAHVEAGDTLERGVARVAAEALELRATVDLRGRRLGPWQIDEKIGEGGMGAVYRAERADGAFTKRVAIKVVRAHVADEGGRRRFYAEREILATIEHPHIARLIDAGTTEEGLPYLVMEYVEGEPVDAYCDDQRLTVDERLALFRLICDAVQSAHDRHIVHRDLKPSNVLITADGTPKLLDFGIAKLLAPEMLDRSVEVTSEAQRLMTPAYCSPEQIRGEPITPASDVYSLGVILYGLLCGHSPYEQTTGGPEAPTETIVCDREPMPPSGALRGFGQAIGPDGESIALTPEAVAEARRTDPDTLCGRLAASLDAIVMKALAKRPGERYATAAALGDALDEPAGPGRASGPEMRRSAPDPADAAAMTVGSSRSPATQLEWGHLEIRDKVGEGMFGRVYRCRDPSLEMTVALKLFRTSSGDDTKLTAEVAGRVLREGRLMARVRHPNVLSVYGVAVHDETVGMWMEYIDGKNLEEVLATHGRFSAGEACLVGIELCSALAAVHGQGLVHRDIKAHNVIREDGGRIVLTDFGSGGDLMGAMPLQGEGAVGTPLYMAPEVLRGGVATARADIYSLGVLLFRLVTGEFPVEADTWSGLIEKHERGERKLTRDLRPDLKPRLAQVLDKAVSPGAEDRFVSAAEMQRALEMAADMSIEPLHLSPTPVIDDDDDRKRDRVKRESLYQTVTAIGTSVLGALFLLGFTTTTAYRQALRIPQRFWSESPLVLPVKGLNALVPVVVEMVFELVVLGVVAALALLIFVIVDRLQRGKDLRGRARRSLGRARARLEAAPPEVTHALLLVSGVIGVALVIYWHREILGVVMSLSDAQASRSIDAALLTNRPGAAGHSVSLTFTVATLILVLCAGLVAFAAFGREVPRDGKLVPVLRAGIFGVILFAAIVAAIPWRLVWDNIHEHVLVDGETAFVIAESGDQAWLYYPRDNRTEMLDLTSPGRSVQRNQPFDDNIFTEPPQQ